MSGKAISRLLLAAVFTTAGILHFTHDTEFARIVPPFLPYPLMIVWVTGVLELAFALGLLLTPYQQLTAIALSLFLLAVLPANIYMAVGRITAFGGQLSDWQAWLRVFLQFPLIALVLWAGNAWPEKKRRAP